MSSEDKYFCFSSDCSEKSILGSKEDLGVHRNQTNNKNHQAIKLNILMQKHKLFQSRVQKVTSNLKQFQKNIGQCCTILVDGIFSVKQKIHKSIEGEIRKHYTTKTSQRSMKKDVWKFGKKEFDQMTCEKISELIQIYNTVGKDRQFETKNKEVYESLEEKLSKQFKNEMNSLFKKQKLLKQNEQMNLFSADISTVQFSLTNKLEESYDQSQQQLLSQFKKPEKKEEKRNFKKEPKKMEEPKYQKSISIDEDSKDYSSIYSQQDRLKHSREVQQKEEVRGGYFTKQKSSNDRPYHMMKKQSQSFEDEPSIISIPDSKPMRKVEEYKPSFKKEQRMQSSSGLSNFLQSIDESESPQWRDNKQRLQQNQSYSYQPKPKVEMKPFQRPPPQINYRLPPGYITIKDLQNKKDDGSIFNLQVQIKKVMYFCLLDSNQPKVKFVAGDRTGYAVFFTCYYPTLQAGACMDLPNSSLKQYNGSYEINNHRYKQINFSPKGIKANMRGMCLNRMLTNDLFYTELDKKCALGIQIADKLQKREELLVDVMFVKILDVQDDGPYALCQVADSTGSFQAYMKKTPAVEFKKDQVVQLNGIKASKTEHSFILDCTLSKVIPHRYKFHEVSQTPIQI